MEGGSVRVYAKRVLECMEKPLKLAEERCTVMVKLWVEPGSVNSIVGNVTEYGRAQIRRMATSGH